MTRIENDSWFEFEFSKCQIFRTRIHFNWICLLNLFGSVNGRNYHRLCNEMSICRIWYQCWSSSRNHDRNFIQPKIRLWIFVMSKFSNSNKIVILLDKMTGAFFFEQDFGLFAIFVLVNDHNLLNNWSHFPTQYLVVVVHIANRNWTFEIRIDRRTEFGPSKYPLVNNGKAKTLPQTHPTITPAAMSTSRMCAKYMKPQTVCKYRVLFCCCCAHRQFVNNNKTKTLI